MARQKRTSKLHPAHLCEHANEVPIGKCPCFDRCYCRSHTCKRHRPDPRMVIIVSPDVYEALKGKRRSPKIVSRDGWPPSHYSLSGIDRTVRGK